MPRSSGRKKYSKFRDSRPPGGEGHKENPSHWYEHRCAGKCTALKAHRSTTAAQADRNAAQAGPDAQTGLRAPTGPRALMGPLVKTSLLSNTELENVRYHLSRALTPSHASGQAATSPAHGPGSTSMAPTLHLPEDDQTGDDQDLMTQLNEALSKLQVDVVNEVNDEVNNYKVLLQDDDAMKRKERSYTPQSSLPKDQNISASRGNSSGIRSANKDEQKIDQQRPRASSVGDNIGSTVDCLYAESEHQIAAERYFAESRVENSIIRLNNLGSSFWCILDNELQMMIKWKFRCIMEKMDGNTEQLSALVNMVEDVRWAGPNRQTVDSGKNTFVCQVLDATGYSTVAELDETLKAHRKFRLYMQNLIYPRSEGEQPVGNSELISTSSSDPTQSKHRQDSRSVQPAEQPGAGICLDASSSVPEFQPFLGDSSVRPKVRKPTLHEKSPEESKVGKKDKEYDSKTPQQNRQDEQNLGEQDTSKGVRILQISKSPAEPETSNGLKRPGIDHDSNTEVQLDTEISKGETCEMTDKSKSLQGVNFEDDLQAIFEEAEDGGGDNYFIVLKGIRDNFELAELLQCLIFQHGEPINIYMGAYSLPAEKIVSLIACVPFPMAPLAPDDKDSTSAGSMGTTQDCADSNQGASVELAQSTGTVETWQSRVRSFYKRISNKPLEHLGSRMKVTELREELCPKCCERYRWPYVLQCCHRFCFPCLVKLYQQDRNCFMCPICLCCSLPLNNSKFGPHYLKVDLTFARKMFEANMSPFCCTNCYSYEDAVKFCETCLLYLCQKCYRLHSQTEPNSQHKLENTDMKIGSTADGKLLAMCTRHPGNSMTQFCKSCWSGVCGVCLQGDHKPHEILELNDVIEMIRERIQANNAHALELSIRFQRLLMDLKQSKQDIEASYRAGRHILAEISNRIKERIDALVTKASEEVRNIHEKMQQQSAKADAERKIFLKELAVFRAFEARYRQLGAPGDVLMLSSTIRDRRFYLEEKYKNNPNLRQRCCFDIKFEPRYPDVNTSIQEMFTALTLEYTNYLSRFLLDSQYVRDRHHVEPCKSPPYSLDYRYESEIAEREALHLTDVGTFADANESMDVQNFLRQTIPCSRAFGRYGRGDYEFAEPSGVLYLHDCSLAVCDTRNHRILIYREDGIHLRTIGQPKVIPDLPPSTEEADKTFPRTVGKLYFPYRMAQCPVTENIIVLERPPSLNIQIFSVDGRFMRSFGNPHLQSPRGITVDERGLILILESKTMNFFIFTQEGELIKKSVIGALEFPNDVATKFGTIYISDNRHHCVKTFDFSLNYKETFGNESLTYYPISVGFNSQGLLVVTDNHNTFNITIFGCDGRVKAGFKSRAKHANCYNVALHPTRPELAVTTKDYQVLIFDYHFSPEGREPRQ